jgi:hypothetical protein
VAGVNFNGRVYGYRTGDCFILAKVDGKTLKCRVHVMDINRKHITLNAGRSKKLKIQGAGSYVKWKSSNTAVASVSMFGRVKGKREGKAIIYGSVKGRIFSCEVKVN